MYPSVCTCTVKLPVHLLCRSNFGGEPMHTVFGARSMEHAAVLNKHAQNERKRMLPFTVLFQWQKVLCPAGIPVLKRHTAVITQCTVVVAIEAAVSGEELSLQC